MKKREVLLAICEAPGWSPPDGSSASIDRSLEELESEGWVIPRLDGFEATPVALDAYPKFTAQPDIAAPPDEPSINHDAHVCVPRDRVVTLVACLLCEMPLSRVASIIGVLPDQIPSDDAIWTLANQLADRMR